VRYIAYITRRLGCDVVPCAGTTLGLASALGLAIRAGGRHRCEFGATTAESQTFVVVRKRTASRGDRDPVATAQDWAAPSPVPKENVSAGGSAYVMVKANARITAKTWIPGMKYWGNTSRAAWQLPYIHIRTTIMAPHVHDNSKMVPRCNSSQRQRLAQYPSA
jgi:hypothetical protein